jgi:UDP-N-acetylglucosamine pyrophosphorylase
VVAGGQGRGLGLTGRRGIPDFADSQKTLFQIFAENLLAASTKYGVTIRCIL